MSRAALGSGLQRTLLARLALGAGAAVGQDELIELLWQHGRDAERGRSSCTRRSPGCGGCWTPARGTGSVLVGGQTGYRLAVGAEHLDLLAFRDLVARAAYDAPEEALVRLAGRRRAVAR